MDCVYYEALDSHMKKYKSKIKSKLSRMGLDKRQLSNQCDLVCMVLDYSPVLKEEKRTFGKTFLTT